MSLLSCEHVTIRMQCSATNCKDVQFTSVREVQLSCKCSTKVLCLTSKPTVVLWIPNNHLLALNSSVEDLLDMLSLFMISQSVYILFRLCNLVKTA